MKRVVVPGELITEERKKIGQHVYVHEGRVYSDVLGLIDDSKEFASVVPLEGPYVPQPGDLVVGVVVSENFGNYIVNINAPHLAFLPKAMLRESFKIECMLSAKVMGVNEVGTAELGGPRAFFGGELISVSAVKVPRVIGKNGSMLEVLRRGTGCTMMVGRNGWIWVNGGNTSLLICALEKIQAEAHTEHLTNKMEEFLNEAGKKAAKPAEEPQPLAASVALKKMATEESLEGNIGNLTEE